MSFKKELAYDVFNNCDYAFIGMNDIDNMPYVFAISPVVIDDDIYFHGGLKGKKIECLKHSANVCVSAAINMEPVAKRFTINYESAIAYGSATIVEDRTIQIKVLEEISKRYAPYNMDDFNNAIERSLQRTNIFKITVNEITGKERKVGIAHVE
ncbi:pyridoxamine 5'-phosphate oxidase family protein [Mycoplasma sp. P36-A1]|uniref:pyridoxamine 5'-phosphate oxidase family protein n=1 Tax=Mycoplasma sp. P36-A1 TaxID=3252900 RepID=UPI003C2C0A1D